MKNQSSFLRTFFVATIMLEVLGAYCHLYALDSSAGYPQILQNDTLKIKISPKTGAIDGICDLRLKKQVIEASDDMYRTRSEKSVQESTEKFDRVISIKREGRSKLTLKCRNEKLKDLSITKTYTFGDSPQEISKKVSFETNSTDGYFLEYFIATTVAPEFLKNGKFDIKATEYFGAGEPTFDSRSLDRILSQYRYKINDRYVMLTTGFNFSDEDRYSDSGWFDPIYADYIRKGIKSSAEVRMLILEGDEFDYYDYYDNLPEVKKIYDMDFSPWLWKECRMDAMYFNRNNPKDFPNMPCMTTRWELNKLWGDYFSEGELVIGSQQKPRPTISAEKVAKQNKGYIEGSPNWKMAMYTWLYTIADETRTLKEHPGFVITGQDGKYYRSKTWNHDVTGLPSYLKQVRAPGFTEYFLKQYYDYVHKMGVQFIYIDGCPLGISKLDWKLKTVPQSYDWLEYFRRVRGLIRKEVPCNGFVFMNNPNMPYADAGYLEDHGMAKHIKEDWRKYARRLMIMKYRERPHRWHALLYWMEANKPYYSNYTLGFGLTYSNGGTEWHAHKLKAYVNAAWELRGMKMVMAVKSPCFWREKTDFEVYSFTKGPEAIVSIISHKKNDADVNICLDIKKLKLNPEKPIYIWQQRMINTSDAKEWKTVPTQCFEKVFLGAYKSADGMLKLSIKTRPILLEQLVLTQSPIWFTEVNGEILKTVQNNILIASIDEVESAKNEFNITVEKGNAKVFILKPLKGALSVLLDGVSAKLIPAELGNASGYEVKIPNGIHKLKLMKAF